jgi:single-stranded-DNA-specific exonuclease
MKVVAIATVADAVPLVDENRVFAKLGLEGLRSAVNPGLKALLEVAQLGGRPLTSGEVAFRIAPRINAAGRMDVARDVVELFSVKDAVRAREIAGRLDRLNAERQEEERRIVECIETRLEEDPSLRDAFCIVVDGEGWHRGVIGITATRVVERHGRPAIVISRDGEEAHGSGRSIKPFHLLNALESCSHLFSRYGGHSHAVGFSLPAGLVPELRAHLDEYARARLTLADFEPALEFDAELPLQEITPEFFALLQRLQPFGVGNPEPVFTAYGVCMTAPPRVMKEKHVKLRLAQGPVSCVPSLAESSFDEGSGVGVLAAPQCHPDAAVFSRAEKNWRKSIVLPALGWRMAERVQQEQLLAGDLLDIAFTLDHNDHPDFGGLELSLRDLKRRPGPVRPPSSGTKRTAEIESSILSSGTR